MARNPLLREAIVWVVSIQEHDVIVSPRGRKIHVPARETHIGNIATADSAKRRALGWAHSDAGVPPWKPCLRASWPFVTAVEKSVETGRA